MVECRVNQVDFITVNHEMGHIQYYLQYSKQSYLFRTGDNYFSFCCLILNHCTKEGGKNSNIYASEQFSVGQVQTRASTRVSLTSFPLLSAPPTTSRFLMSLYPHILMSSYPQVPHSLMSL
jgi:hypothetical protein